MSQTYQYQLTLTFRGPLLSKASGTLSFNVDSAMLRDDDQPVLNGSLIRGNIREAMKLFAAELRRMQNLKAGKIEDYIVDWFGAPSSNDLTQGDDFIPKPGSAEFDFFWLLSKDYPYNKKDDQYRSRIKVDASGKVEPGALQIIEDCFPMGSRPVFTGSIRATLDDDSEADYFQRLLEMALEYIPALGSFKGIGFGKLEGYKLTPLGNPKPAITTQPHSPPQNGDGLNFGFEFTPDRPFCLAKPQTPGSNRIVSETIINGNVIKALLAKALEQTGTVLADIDFDRWQITHCLPVAEKTDPGRQHQVIPLSIAALNSGYSDMYTTTAEQFAQLQSSSGKIPAFQPDWKHGEDDYWQQVRGAVGKPVNPSRKLRVRTAIESHTQTAAEGGLFSMECVAPEGFVWRGNIGLAQVEEGKQAKAQQALQDVVETPLTGLGKTKATLQNFRLLPKVFSRLDTGAADTIINLAQEQLINLTLLTPARLFPLGWERKKNASRQTAHDLYRDYWQRISDNSLLLHNFFAQQQRCGGVYHYHKFQRDGKHVAYAPEWLTHAGSVFVMRVAHRKTAAAKLKEWSTQGLPIPEGEAVTWQDSPYLREHGYGEIALNWFPLDGPAKSPH